MSSNKTFRETLAFLIVRDNAHQNAFAKALETLGVDWGKLFPVPNYVLTSIQNAGSMLNWAFTMHSLIFDWILPVLEKYSMGKLQAETVGI